MKLLLKYRLPFFFFCFYLLCANISANDTIRFVARCPMSLTINIIATSDEPFAIDWGDDTAVEIQTGTGTLQAILHFYNIFFGTYSILVTGNTSECFFSYLALSVADTYFLDVSSCSELTFLSCSTHNATLKNLNINNCPRLKLLNVFENQLVRLDLSDNSALEDMVIANNQLCCIEFGTHDALSLLACYENRLPLSILYVFSNLITNPNAKALGEQFFLLERLKVGGAADFSDQTEFGGIQTVFYVEKGSAPAPQSDYSLENGVITFFNQESYKVTMSNAAIISNPFRPAYVEAPFQVIDFVAVEEIIDVPNSTKVGETLLLRGTILPANASFQSIAWSICDTGTTCATLNGWYLTANKPGTVVVTATIKNGRDFDVDYTQNFAIEVEPLGIYEPTLAFSLIQVHPNPITGELSITNEQLTIREVNVLDIYGRKVFSYPITQASNLITLNISHLSAGIYFLQINNEIQKIVKN